MYCPLFTAASISKTGKGDKAVNQCEKTECAWWEKVHNECVLQSVYQELRLLVGAISMLADKMPPARR